MNLKFLFYLKELFFGIIDVYIFLITKILLKYYQLPIVTLFISGLLMNFVQALLYVTLRPISKKLFRKINKYICASMYAQVVFLPEWMAEVDLVIYVDPEEFSKYYGKEHSFCIINHTYEIDWLINWLFCTKIGCLGNFKACSKTDAKWLPAFGWSWCLSDFAFLERSFDKDESVLIKQIKEMVDHPDPIWLTFYPEGTRYTKEKHEMSKEFAMQNGLPTYKHHLLPRTKGFLACLPLMKEKVGGLYDIVFAFKGPKGPRTRPSLFDLLRGDRIQAHVYLRRIPFKEVPQEKQAAVKFLYELFDRKDKLQDSFYTSGDFFASSGVKRLPGVRLKKGYTSLLNVLIWNTIFTLPITFYCLKLLFVGRYLVFLTIVAAIPAALWAANKCLDYSSIKTASNYGMGVKKQN